MPLKLGTISEQIEHMARTVVALSPAQEEFLEQAQALLRSIPVDALRQKLALQRQRQVRFPWLVAIPYGALYRVISAPPAPADFCVIGVDASSIPPDRHSSVRFYVLNVGYAALTYGRYSDAVLDAKSQLYFLDDDLYLFPEKRDVPVEGVLLNARMELESLHVLQEVIQNRAYCSSGGHLPTVALRDGPLILWTLQNESQEVQDKLLYGFLEAMSSLRQVGIPLAGYISYTDSRDVANSLRVWICQDLPNECEHCKSSARDLCLALAKIRDRDLFHFLAAGERSELFASSSQILERYGEHRVDFFYLNVGREIVRVEVPHWVSADAELLGLLHASIYDQCQRSPGFPPYPPALLEAHEQAVITTAERRLIEELVERALGLRGQWVTRSAKDDSKRRRGV
ncbi:MAG: DNA double-strand break repair nuclease NurA [Anaerolineae bacterium]